MRESLLKLLRNVSSLSTQAELLNSAVQVVRQDVHSLEAELLKVRQAPPALDTERRLQSMLRSWREHPEVTIGPWHAYDLIWLGRITDPVNPNRPLFPEVQQKILSLQNPDGSLVSPSPFPYSNLIIALVLANTLIQWDKEKYRARIQMTLEYALREFERQAQPLYTGAKLPYGKYYLNQGFWGKLVILPYECAKLFEHQDLLTKAQQQAWQPYVRMFAKSKPPIDVARVFDGTFNLSIHLGECYPNEVLQSEAARRHAEDETHPPGFGAAYSARYYEVTRDENALRAIHKLLPRISETLRPGARLQEAGFVLRYLIKGGIDVLRHCRAEVDYVLANLFADGAPVDDRANERERDPDGTALAQFIANALGVPSNMATQYMDGWWNPATRSYYMPSNDSYTPVTTTAVYILEANLWDSKRSHAEKRAVWQRTIRMLHDVIWVDMTHIFTPINTWETVISTLFPFEHLFPEDRTRVHYDVLELMLQLQQPGGGFQSCYFDKPNIQETSFALLALKTVLSCSIPDSLRRRVTAAAQRAESFMIDYCSKGYDPYAHDDIWIAKLTYTPVHCVEAIIVASLYRPVGTIAAQT